MLWEPLAVGEMCVSKFLKQAKPAVHLALKEDIGGGDVTTLATIPAATRAQGFFLAKSSGIIAGLDVAALTYGLLAEWDSLAPHGEAGETVQFCPQVGDGDRVCRGDCNRQCGRFSPDPADGRKSSAELCAAHVWHLVIDTELR